MKKQVSARIAKRDEKEEEQENGGCCGVYFMLFRRDLRLFDNTAFSRCLEDASRQHHAVHVVPVFIYNSEQTNSDFNAYFGSEAFRFLNANLDGLDHQLTQIQNSSTIDIDSRARRLHARSTEEETNVLFEEMLSMQNSKKKTYFRLYFNRDLTPFARQRDARLRSGLRSRFEDGIENKNAFDFDVTETEDYSLVPMDDPCTKSKQGHTYTVFSWFYKKRRDIHDRIPSLPTACDATYDLNATENKNENANNSPRSEALDILDRIRNGEFRDYETSRNDLARDVHGTSTTRLSKYLKFGSISVREAYWAIFDAHGLDHSLIRELLFREFYYGVAWTHPRVLRGMVDKGHKNEPFDKNIRVRDVRWISVAPGTPGAALLEAWKQGRTGVPLVDAGMRQLNATGFMHNRCRMVTAMFLTKDLLIDWREGEMYFASKLIDYDPVQNGAGWQWSASVGNDAAPYFRIFNPYTQQARFDPDAVYVRHWVPEIAEMTGDDKALVKMLSKWEDPGVRSAIRKKQKEKARKQSSFRYPDPVIQSHAEASAHAKEAYINAMTKKTNGR